MLSSKNPHPRDKDLFYIDETHTYIVNQEKYTSVTQFVSQQFEPFKKDLIIYILRKYNPEYKDKTKQQIISEWDQARDYGSLLHADIERYYNGEAPKNLPLLEKEYKMFLNYVEDFKSLIPYRTEWRIFSENIKIAGTIDMIYQKKNGHYIIVDWKRAKKIDKNDYKKYSLTIPGMPDTNFYHYSLQLNLYKYILETCYDMIVDHMYLCCLHPNQDNYQLYEIESMEMFKLFS
jgi:hypothetical protein